ncbi:unnamed protein product, partial [Meganyctiphanes norvegica]
DSDIGGGGQGENKENVPTYMNMNDVENDNTFLTASDTHGNDISINTKNSYTNSQVDHSSDKNGIFLIQSVNGISSSLGKDVTNSITADKTPSSNGDSLTNSNKM